MKTFTFIKLAVASLALVVLSGCVANVKPVNAEASYAISESKVSADHPLVNNVSVETNDFLETSKTKISLRTANLNNEEAKVAIEESLNSAGMYVNNLGQYLLTARLVDADNANFSGDRMRERNISIHYILSDNSGSSFYNNIILGEGRNNIPLMGSQWTQENITATRAYQDNFRQLIEDLRKL